MLARDGAPVQAWCARSLPASHQRAKRGQRRSRRKHHIDLMTDIVATGEPDPSNG